MIKLTLVPYVLSRDPESGKSYAHSSSISSNIFKYDSEASGSFDLFYYYESVLTSFLDSRSAGDLAYCFFVVADNGFSGIVRPYIVEDLAFGLVGTYTDLGAYVWDYNFEVK